MPRPVMVINGPNLNRLGTREPHIYGSTTLAEVEEMCRQRAKQCGITVDCRQSNSESQIVEWVHEAIDTCDGIVINPAAYTHSSVAIMDALHMFKQPIVELHISNPHKREPFRHHSYVTMAATALICGLGVDGYPIAVEAVAGMIKAKAAAKKA